jgi:hypothetical protein
LKKVAAFCGCNFHPLIAHSANTRRIIPAIFLLEIHSPSGERANYFLQLKTSKIVWKKCNDPTCQLSQGVALSIKRATGENFIGRRLQWRRQRPYSVANPLVTQLMMDQNKSNSNGYEAIWRTTSIRWNFIGRQSALNISQTEKKSEKLHFVAKFMKCSVTGDFLPAGGATDTRRRQRLIDWRASCVYQATATLWHRSMQQPADVWLLRICGWDSAVNKAIIPPQHPKFTQISLRRDNVSRSGPTFHSANVNNQPADEMAFRTSFAYQNLHIRAGRLITSFKFSFNELLEGQKRPSRRKCHPHAADGVDSRFCVPKCHQQPANQIKRDLEAAAALFYQPPPSAGQGACRCPELLRNFRWPNPRTPPECRWLNRHSPPPAIDSSWAVSSMTSLNEWICEHLPID